MEIKKPYAVIQYNKFMKGLDKADQYLSYYSVEGLGYQKSRIEVSQVLMTFNCQRRKHQGGLNTTRQADSTGISEYTNLKKIVAGGEGKKKYPARQCKMCTAHKKQSETRYICKFCIILLHKGSCFEKYHSIKYYQTICMLFLQFQAQEHILQCYTASKRMLMGLNIQST